MQQFNIELNDSPFDCDGDLLLSGRISIGDFSESFHASLSYWDRDKYISQWRDGLKGLKTDGDKSILVTNMYDPKKANFVFAWVLYLIDGMIHIQNNVVFLDETDQPLDENNLQRYVPPREKYSADGEKISEWVIELDDIKRANIS